MLGQSGSVAIVLGPEFRGVDPATELAKVRDRLPALRETFTLAPDSVLWQRSAPVALPDVDPSSLAMMQYTSGTTGRPKGAMLSHRSLCNNSRLFNRRLGLDGAGSWVNAMPMFHIGGSSFGAIGSMWSRAAHIITTFDAALMLELIETERPAFLPSVPTMLLAMSEHPDFLTRDHSSIQVIMAGSTTIPAELIRRVEKEWGANFVPCYGQTECSGVIVQGMPEDTPEDKSAWAGRPLEQVEVRVVDPATGEVVPSGEVGEFHVRGYTTMDGYFAMPEETASTLDAEGWLHTGDLGVMDPRGYCQVTGRLKDMIIRGGENVYPARDRGRADRPRGDQRDRGHRPARRTDGRRGHRRRPTRPGCRGRPGRLARVRPGQPRLGQGAAALVRRRRDADHAVGEDPEVQAARPDRRRRCRCPRRHPTATVT